MTQNAGEGWRRTREKGDAERKTSSEPSSPSHPQLHHTLNPSPHPQVHPTLDPSPKISKLTFPSPPTHAPTSVGQRSTSVSSACKMYSLSSSSSDEASSEVWAAVDWVGWG